MPIYRERLWPAPWLFLATALVIPASLLVFFPINMWVGVVVALVLYLGCIGLMVGGAPVIEVSEGVLRAGKARLPLTLVGAAEPFSGAEASLERGQRLDARAYLVIRGWVDPVVRVELLDPNDPAPYWLLSTRRPEELAAALTSTRAEL